MSISLILYGPTELNAIVPTVGFNLSTWSLPYVKYMWLKLHRSRNNATKIDDTVNVDDNKYDSYDSSNSDDNKKLDHIISEDYDCDGDQNSEGGDNNIKLKYNEV